MRFLIDAQLPVSLARCLVARGHEAHHVSSLKMSDASDTVIWNYAIEIDAIVITKDEDFAQRRWFAKTGPVIVWVRLGNAGTKALLEWFEQGFPSVGIAVKRGETLIELARGSV